ncbi:hypothetical protein JNW91_28830 [Micromonospora sp. STR1_7]|uniref:DUF397 domain-containing protein n=1 Tax=Micromonospora parastrephiae TaxID=2806101 RepID=A0ABS1Y208_9ACTN|nr:hypothetical protein [Micromonospora parastrephiae]MBM0235434.1 hypothetical protein [Micromonospora parastrephiae]
MTGPAGAAEPDPNRAAERLEVAIDAALNRVLRSSHRPEQQIVVSWEAWAAFLASVRAGQDY